MITFPAALAATLTLTLQVVSTPPPSGPPPVQDDRQAVLPDIPGLTPSVHAALLGILERDFEILQASRPVDAEGKEITDPRAYQARLADPEGPLQLLLDKHTKGFDMRRLPGAQARYIAELVRFDAGFQAAKELAARDPDWAPASLLELLGPDFLAAESLWNSQEAELFSAEGLKRGELAPLTNPSALAYLIWGCLRLDEHWSAEQHDKEEFIASLLQAGFSNPTNAAIVTRAIEYPLSPPSRLEALRFYSRGHAGPYLQQRAKVGFTELHEALLEADLDHLPSMARVSPRTQPSPSEAAAGSKLPGTEASPASADVPAHLAEWLPKTLLHVRRELYPLGVPEIMRVSAHLSERRLYWRAVFTTYGFEVGREMVLDELARIIASQEEHPLTPRIDELLLLKDAGVLTPEEQAELSELLAKRDSDRNGIIESCLQEMSLAGYADHHELLIQTLANDVEDVLADLHPMVRDPLVQQGWTFMAIGSQPLNMQSTLDQLAGLRSDIPAQGLSMMIRNAGIHEYPGHEDFTRKVLSEAPIASATTGLLNATWMDAIEYRQSTQRFLDAYDQPDSEWADRIMTVSHVIAGLHLRNDPKERHTLLLELVEQGRFTSASENHSFLPHLTWQAKDYMKEILSPAEIAEFVQQGQLDPGVL